MSRLETVERRKNISVEEFRDRYAIPNVPVVLEGLADEWPARALWTFDFFKEHYGAHDVTIYTGERKTKPRIMKLGSYLEYMHGTRDENPDYLSRWCLADFPELAAQYQRPPHFPCWSDHLPSEVRPTWKWLYMGPRGSGSELHRDFLGSSAWNMLLAGEKTWHFYPPSEPFSGKGGVVCVQRPGDIIFTPSDWWHEVRNETSTLALTENFVNETNARYLRADDEQDRRTLKLLAHHIESLSLMSLPR